MLKNDRASKARCSTVRDSNFRKVLRLFPAPGYPQPALRPVAARLAFVPVMVVALVPALALELVSLHFRQPWHALLVVPRMPEHDPNMTHSRFVS